MSGVTFFREQDADPAALRGTCAAVLGYGNLGRSMALNLRDSGLEVVVGNIDDEHRRTAVNALKASGSLMTDAEQRVGAALGG